YYLVWEENNTIKYAALNASGGGNSQIISNGDGYTYKNNPSQIVLNDTLSRICWKGKRYTPPYWEKRVVFRSINNNHFWYFGFNVSPPNINKADDQSYYSILWNHDENSTYFADNSLSTIRQIGGLPGSSVQVSNGSTKDQMFAEVFNISSEPYYFKTSNSIGSYYTPHKITNYSFSSGREGIISKDTAQFYFTFGDVLVDNQSIDFIEIPDSTVFDSKEILNQYLVSEPFQLTDNSTFLYSIQYGITDSSAAFALFDNSGKFISFKLQLVDNQSSEVLGTFDEVIYDQSNIYQYSSLSYEVNTSGIGNREVYLRLAADDNFDLDYSLAEIYSTGDLLQKTKHTTIDYEGVKAVKAYELSNNFPNPFNPTTIINYQLPRTGFVTLKVYDILGKEVTTLVNEQKTQGRYSVNFNASHLASGVYIYQIRVNDYVSSKKMLLLK
ncbi:MAG TPA: T9SS type A sorting domain-containing protein, partial [Ignavibacteriaceae bacterium]|nr:T9SS type A sorting domain-containing protein [Ignavibacteriaceae bacterium]